MHLVAAGDQLGMAPEPRKSGNDSKSNQNGPREYDEAAFSHGVREIVQRAR